jgi:N-acetylmuramoyl-L-alanine amidase
LHTVDSRGVNPITDNRDFEQMRTRTAIRAREHQKKRNRNIVITVVACALAAGIVIGLVFALSKGSSGNVKVPDVVGLTYARAEGDLVGAGLEIDIDPQQEFDINEDCGSLEVLWQDPKGEYEAEKGTMVTVHLSGLPDRSTGQVDDSRQGENVDTWDRPGRTVCVDPGHSTNCPSSEIDQATGLDVADNGGASGELQAMWDLSERLKAKLEAMGHRVVLTKPSADSYASLRTRADIGNSCDIVVRLHYDPGLQAILYPGEGQYKSRGDHTAYVDPQVASGSKQLAEALLPFLQTVGVPKIMNDCGGTSNNHGPAFVGSVLSTVPVVLIEYDPSTVSGNPEGRERVAAATADGIDAYFQNQ